MYPKPITPIGDEMADNDSDLMAEFQEFLTQKRQAEKDEQQAEDFEVEIWDKDGRGVRTRRSHAKPFLQSLGIDVDPPTDDDGSTDSGKSGKDNTKGSGQTKGATRNSTGSQSTVRKYFVKNPAAK